MTQKICFKCNLSKSRDEFYAHRKMTDGLLGKCKECTKKDVKDRSKIKREYVRAYDKVRNQTQNRKKLKLKYQRNFRRKHPLKDKAWNAVQRAIRAGQLIRKPCEICGSPNVEAHHDDYTKPLEVQWLCFIHHREMHGQNAVYKPSSKIES